MTEINFPLLGELAKKSHPLLNIVDDALYGAEIGGTFTNCSGGVGETMQEARSAHHLLDMAGIPRGRGYSSDLDARTYLALRKILEQAERLDRIATWHSRESGPGGMVGDFCTECGERWPCDTRRMADGTHEDLIESIETPEQSAAIVDANLTQMGLTLGGVRELEPGESEGPDIATSTTSPEQPPVPHLGPAPYLPEQRQGGSGESL